MADRIVRYHYCAFHLSYSMDLINGIWLCEAQQVIVSLQWLGVVLKLFSYTSGFTENERVHEKKKV